MAKQNEIKKWENEMIKKQIEETIDRLNCMFNHYITLTEAIMKTVLSDEEKKRRIKNLRWQFLVFLYYNIYNSLVLIATMFDRSDLEFKEVFA